MASGSFPAVRHQWVVGSVLRGALSWAARGLCVVPAAFPVGEFCLQQSVFTVVQEALLVRNVLATPGRKTCPVHAAHPPLSPAAAMGVLSPPGCLLGRFLEPNHPAGALW